MAIDLMNARHNRAPVTPGPRTLRRWSNDYLRCMFRIARSTAQAIHATAHAQMLINDPAAFETFERADRWEDRARQWQRALDRRLTLS